ncbi:MAG: phage integrase N-terminal SAM-like domain-containing protein [Acidobacteria bacterium]|nr:phage integrase N-terminal SAM-like domain-containing protein [Acidobacteriota bacterium]
MTPLRQRMIEDMQLRGLATQTQRGYVLHVAAFARYFGKSPAELDQEAVRQYILYLINERKMSPGLWSRGLLPGDHPYLSRTGGISGAGERDRGAPANLRRVYAELLRCLI